MIKEKSINRELTIYQEKESNKKPKKKEKRKKKGKQKLTRDGVRMEEEELLLFWRNV